MAKKKTSSKQTATDLSDISASFLEQQSFLKNFLSRYLYNRQDIEDVVQETFLKAYSAEQGKRIEQTRPFLFRIAKNIAISQLRQQKRRPTDYIEDLEPQSVLVNEYSAEDEAIAQQRLGLHCEAVAALSLQVRRVYLMRKVYGMSHKEIAERLGIARSTVEKHLMKGVEMCDRYTRKRMQENSDNATEHKVSGG